MENTSQTPGQVENLLDNLEVHLVQASSGKRLANYLIDHVVFYLLWKFLLARLLVSIFLQINLDLENRYLFIITVWLVGVFIEICIMAGFESLCGGKTIGKFITGTRAVNMDGSPISPQTAFLRCLSRIVPFEVFSALGSPPYPWHDRWTNTYVIDERASILPV